MNRIVLSLFLLLFCSLPLRAEETIWSGLIYATNEEKPAEKPAPVAVEMEKLSGRLKRVFGYKQFHLVSQHRAPIKCDKSKKWLLPGKPFSLAVNSESSGPVGYKLDLELFQEKRLLVKTGATLKRGSPVLIKGPLCAQGQLIIALAVE